MPFSFSQWQALTARLMPLMASVLLASCTFKGATQIVYLKPGQVQVLPGDTLASVALRHQVSVRDLAQCNHLKPPYSLKGIGVLTLPSHDNNAQSGDSGVLQPHETEAREQEEGPSLIQGENQVQWSSMDEDGLQEEAEDGVAKASPAQSKPKQSMVADVAGHDDEGMEYDDETEKPETKPAPKRSMAMAETVRSRVTPDMDGEGPLCTFIKPVSGDLKRAFNAKKGSDGVDFATKTREPVQAVASGVVVHAGPMAGEKGAIVLIKHADGWSSCYRSLDSVKVRANQKVAQGEKVGSTINRTLRFDLRQNRKPVDPMKHLDR